MTGRFALAATAKARPTRKATLIVCELDGEDDGDCADDEGGDAGDADFLAGAVFFSVVEDVGVEVVREAGAGADGEAGDDGEDGGEGDGADEGEEDFAAERLREQRGGHVSWPPCAMMWRA